MLSIKALKEGLSWKPGATKHQKIVSTITIVLIFSSFFYLVFRSNFVPDETTSKLTLYVSAILTVILLAALAYLYSAKLWRPAPKWYEYSTFIKIALGLLSPVFVFAFLWVSIAFTYPQLFTDLFGEIVIKDDKVTKTYDFNKYMCDYSLKPDSVDTLLFIYCISKKKYDALPNGKIDAKMRIKQSSLGFTVEYIDLNDNKH